MRLVIADMLRQDASIEVIDTASNGKEAYEKTIALKPDVVVLDLVMEKYDGLYAVKKITAVQPTPIIILSSLGNVNPDIVVEALNAGAFSFVNKPQGILNAHIREVNETLIDKIKLAAGIDTKKLIQKNQKIQNTNPHTFEQKLAYHVIVIGASTGGTGAIENILLNLPSNLPIPLLIAQHIPENFVHSFANRLNDLVPLEIAVAQEDEILRGGKVYITTCSSNTKLKKHADSNKVRIGLTEEKYPQFNNPSIDSLMLSVAQIYGDKAIGVLLTGMGRDGVQGLSAIYHAGGFTIAQDEKTSVVFGMPKAAIEEGVARFVLPLADIAPFLVGCL
ncbi:MAG: chemotaxis-specific protein-glutamate methyltransferase CheB [Cytophagales bacterium]|nr:MAG: chemotaxis-specific protein-glutamate methyltransferase CheB [Cytophagales bacterium]